VLALQSLGKPYHCKCQHLSWKGCNIYKHRPPDCRKYECLWLAGMGVESDRPDSLGLLWHWRSEQGELFVDVHEMRPGAFAGLDNDTMQRLCVQAQQVVMERYAVEVAGFCLFAYGLPIGAAFDSQPPYPQKRTKDMLFRQAKEGEGVFVYLGPGDEHGNLLVDGERWPKERFEERYRQVVQLIENGP
jgi:hypothetical protein